MRNENLMVVDIAGIEATADSAKTLVTYALGSCIAVTLYDPVRRAAGMIHFMLPLSKTSPAKAKDRPGMFADTGIPILFQQMYALGCRKEDLVVKVAGGGKLYDDHGTFDIGRRNYVTMRKMFWKNQVIIAAEDVGGAKSRTVRLEVATGTVRVEFAGEGVEL